RRSGPLKPRRPFAIRRRAARLFRPAPAVRAQAFQSAALTYPTALLPRAARRRAAQVGSTHWAPGVSRLALATPADGDPLRSSLSACRVQSDIQRRESYRASALSTS